MTNDRIATLERLLERSPEGPRVLFGLAMEHEKLGQWDRVVGRLTRYLELADDEGNAWGRLGHALAELGRIEEARNAYARGIAEASGHGHPSMALEFEEAVAGLG